HREGADGTGGAVDNRWHRRDGRTHVRVEIDCRSHAIASVRRILQRTDATAGIDLGGPRSWPTVRPGNRKACICGIKCNAVDPVLCGIECENSELKVAVWPRNHRAVSKTQRRPSNFFVDDAADYRRPGISAAAEGSIKRDLCGIRGNVGPCPP